MKIAILWTGLSGYLNACLKELAGREGVELFVSHCIPEENSPFDSSQFNWIKNRLAWNSEADLQSVRQKVRIFAPDILVFSGWHVPAYRRVARESVKRCWRVMGLDRCWLATPRQRIGKWIAPFYVRPLADAIWVPGERQATFARKLGFEQRAILRGLYTCDHSAFAAAYERRISERRSVPRSFLFVGRFVPEKCVHTLVTAYSEYRRGNPAPWPLVCCGAGPLKSLLEGRAGIRLEGFVQPGHLPDVLTSAGCLVLPSEFEPWGLVVHEAASAGLILLASDKVGAVPHLVQPGYNGFICDSRDVKGLAALMRQIADMSDSRREEMSRASFNLSRQYSPRMWVDTLLDSFYAYSGNPSMRDYSMVEMN